MTSWFFPYIPYILTLKDYQRKRGARILQNQALAQRQRNVSPHGNGKCRSGLWPQMPEVQKGLSAIYTIYSQCVWIYVLYTLYVLYCTYCIACLLVCMYASMQVCMYALYACMHCMQCMLHACMHVCMSYGPTMVDLIVSDLNLNRDPRSSIRSRWPSSIAEKTPARVWSCEMTFWITNFSGDALGCTCHFGLGNPIRFTVLFFSRIFGTIFVYPPY